MKNFFVNLQLLKKKPFTCSILCLLRCQMLTLKNRHCFLSFLIETCLFRFLNTSGQTSPTCLVSGSLSFSLSTSEFLSLVTGCHGFKGLAEAGLGAILGTAARVGLRRPFIPRRDARGDKGRGTLCKD